MDDSSLSLLRRSAVAVFCAPKRVRMSVALPAVSGSEAKMGAICLATSGAAFVPTSSPRRRV